MDPQIVGLVVRLGEVALRNTAGFIADRVQAAKTKKNQAETVAELEEIISSLINDKNEVVQIAQALEQELVAQRISDTEIDYVTTNILPVIEKLVKSGDAKPASASDAIEQIKPILSEEMLKILQLLGFNFKQAIGEPLTVLIRELIISQAPRKADEIAAAQLSQQQMLEVFRLAQDPDAFARFQAIAGSFDQGDMPT